MKIAISVPLSIFKGAEQLARKAKKSRSQLYSDAVAEYVARHDPDEVTESMNRVCEQVDTRSDPPLRAAARRVLERSEW